jgi:hypothetical protein
MMHSWAQKVAMLAVGAQMLLFAGFSCAIILHPGGAQDVLL